MAEITWIKLSIGLFDDEKIKIIESMPDKDSLLIIWIKLLIQAGKSNSGGYIRLTETIPYTEEMLASIFGRPLNTIRLALTTFHKFGMIEMTPDAGIYLTNWAKYQNVVSLDDIKEKNRVRQAKSREKQRAQKELLLASGKTEDVSRDSSVTTCDTSREVTQENRIDKNRIDKEVEKNKNRGDKGVQGGINPLPTLENDTNKIPVKKNDDFLLPNWIDKILWEAYMETRKKLKAPPTKKAVELIIKDLETFKNNGDDPGKVLEQSIKRGWRGVLPLKDNQEKKNSFGQKEKMVDNPVLKSAFRNIQGIPSNGDDVCQPN
jgi:predicted phage replisome organizer